MTENRLIDELSALEVNVLTIRLLCLENCGKSIYYLTHRVC